jgi:hypothetical protein
MDRFDDYLDHGVRWLCHIAARAIELPAIIVAGIAIGILIFVDWIFD